METYFKRNITQSYMVVKDQCYAGYDLEMFQKNSIAGFLPFEVIVADGLSEYWYEITGMQILDVYLQEAQITFPFLKSLLLSIEKAVHHAKKYLLPEEKICIEPDKIAISVNTGEFYLCYLPNEENGLAKKLRELMEVLLPKIDHQDEAAVQAAYAIYDRMLEDNFSFTQIRDALLKAKYEEKEEPDSLGEKLPEHEAQCSEAVEDRKRLFSKLSLPQPGWESIRKRVFRRKRNETCSMQIAFEPEEEETEVVNPTILLAPHSGIVGKLNYNGRNRQKDFLLEKEVFYIGTREEVVDAVLDSAAVSRIHACIRRRGEDYYLEDQNSKNGTWLGEELLNYRESRKLQKNDKIRFADEEYIFS